MLIPMYQDMRQGRSAALNKGFKYNISREFESFVTFWMLKIIDGFAWGGIGAHFRAYILRLLGFKIGKNSKIMTGIVIHKRNSNLSIGENTFINKNVFFDLSTAPIKIGNHCDIGFNTTFSNNTHELKSNYQTRRLPAKSLPIKVEDFVWIGCNATVLGGVTVGKGSVIAAGSVVTKDVPPEVLAAGVPARVIKKL